MILSQIPSFSSFSGLGPPPATNSSVLNSSIFFLLDQHVLTIRLSQPHAPFALDIEN